MKQNEVVETLQYYITNIEDVSECKKDAEALTEAIRCVELLPELIEVLETSEKFLLHVKFFPDGCNCYEDYICQSCRASDIWRKLDELLKKVKGESDGQ
jgi:hypothetical protein